MQTNGSPAQVVVIGGGLSGLTAALVAAREGRPVTLIERSTRPGGRAITREHEGFRFNLGPHALYPGAARLLRELGIEVAGAVPRARALAYYRGDVTDLPASPGSLLTARIFNLAEKAEAARHLLAFTKGNTSGLYHVPAGAWLQSEVRSPEVRRYLAALIRVATYTNAEETLSMGSALDQFRGAGQGVVYVHDGWQTIVDALRSAAGAAGVQFLPGRRAVQVVSEDGQVTGVALDDGTLVPAAAAVAAVGPSIARDLVSGVESPLARWSEDAIPVYASCLDIALASLPRPDRLFVLGLDTPLYLSVHSATARLAPGDGATVLLAKYLEPGAPSDHRATEQQLLALMDAVQPGWREVVVERRFLPSLLVSNAVVSAKVGGTRGRPGPAVNGLDGFYVAGDWVGGEGQLTDAALTSGRDAGRLAAGVASNPRHSAVSAAS